MEDNYLQSDNGIFTDENLIQHMDEERLADSFGDNIFFHSESLTTHKIPTMGDKQLSCIQCDKAFYQ